MKWSRFNEQLGLVAIVGIPVLWILHGVGVVVLPGEILGGTLAGWMLVLQFFFRKKESESH